MKTYFVRFAVLAVLAALTSASNLTAQDTASASLSEADVRQLIVRGEPADHTRLSAHFATMAQRYVTDAKRHETMGQAFSGDVYKRQHVACMARR